VDGMEERLSGLDCSYGGGCEAGDLHERGCEVGGQGAKRQKAEMGRLPDHIPLDAQMGFRTALTMRGLAI